MRFLIPPDPVEDYLTDQGIVEEYEAKDDITIETTSSWDEFQFFAGGHGDIVSTGKGGTIAGDLPMDLPFPRDSSDHKVALAKADLLQRFGAMDLLAT